MPKTGTPKVRTLHAKEQLFADGILSGKKVRQAYTDAGYKASKTDQRTSEAASRLASSPQVAAYLELKRQAAYRRADITLDWWVKEVVADVRQTESKSARTRALELMGRHLGAFQSDRRNDQDHEADLYRDVVVQYAMMLHVRQGIPLPEAAGIARRDPKRVEAWGVEKGLIAKPAQA